MKTSWAALLAILAATGCGGPSVRVSADRDPYADLSLLKTFDWFPPPAGQPMRRGLHEHIDQWVVEELVARGYARITAREPDFYIATQAAVEHRIEALPDLSTEGYSASRLQLTAAATDSRIIEEGALVVNVISPRTKAVIWRGHARGALDRSLTPEQREERLRGAIRSVLALLP